MAKHASVVSHWAASQKHLPAAVCEAIRRSINRGPCRGIGYESLGEAIYRAISGCRAQPSKAASPTPAAFATLTSRAADMPSRALPDKPDMTVAT
ncbi:hypothetical protein NK8_73370 (plasmid) [Caballeronia sp. NK8]|nr:hypothetical protein NK8_73370 [Caballeronia sp. NK8]